MLEKRRESGKDDAVLVISHVSPQNVRLGFVNDLSLSVEVYSYLSV